uniref:Type II secretory pathway, component PulF n=1 Tax=Candidatus Kentrum sp. FM TaxID=2126340 RepID=A0A450VRU9_9GAMM|nr:MAG: Type II secretory pathway, component PulF [Candidatus Kentron sp. FM]VFJ70858.1 MAG: Type II secretory pathway, component PulF [Candidatus Kentron sp. FM]VFK07485.1 MAG: Type II secretory pathway, component PulF [Candidatus Kentron sp. FM]
MANYMNFADIMTAAAALGNQLAAGIPVQDALARMPQLQRKLAHVWEPIADAVRDGSPLSHQLEDVWPENMVSAVRAAELSGSLPEVFKRIEETLAIRKRIIGLAGQLIMPFLIILGAIGASIFYMIAVIPGIGRIAGPTSMEGNPVFRLSAIITDVYDNHWVMALLVMAATIAAIGSLLTRKEVQVWIQSQLDGIPLVNDAMRQLAFGLWANYLSAVDSAGGIDMPTKLRLTAPVLPEVYREGVLLVAEEVIRRGLRNAVDPDKQAENDPRRKWPFYITIAFLLAAEHGELAKELARATPPMLEDGFKKATLVFNIMNLLAMLIAAILIVIPVGTMYTTIGDMINKSM